MLLDATHKKWIGITAVVAAAAVILHVGLSWNRPGGLTGGSTVGLWYGVAGSALMVFAGLLSALRRVPSWWWIGSRQAWLRGHIWLGLLSGVLILCHSGYRWGGLLEGALWVVLLAVLITGVYGLVLQQILPGLLAKRVPNEASYEQLPHLYRVLRVRADELVEAIELWPAEAAAGGEASDLRPFYEGVVRPYLDGGSRRSPLAAALQTEGLFARVRGRLGLAAVEDHANAAETLFDEIRARVESAPDKKDLLLKTDGASKKVRDQLIALPEVAGLAAAAKRVFAELPAFPDQTGAAPLVRDVQRVCQARWLGEVETVCRERRAYAEQERIHHWLHGWLLLHIPLSAALLVLGVLHAVLSLYY